MIITHKVNTSHKLMYVRARQPRATQAQPKVDIRDGDNTQLGGMMNAPVRNVTAMMIRLIVIVVLVNVGEQFRIVMLRTRRLAVAIRTREVTDTLSLRLKSLNFSLNLIKEGLLVFMVTSSNFNESLINFNAAYLKLNETLTHIH